MTKKVRVRTIVVIEGDDDGKKADKLRAKLLKKSLKRKRDDGATVAEIEIVKVKA